MVSTAFLLMWLLDDFSRRWLGLEPKSPPGPAVVKVSDAVILLIAVGVLGKLFRIDFDSICLRKGRLRLGWLSGWRVLREWQCLQGLRLTEWA